MSRAVVIGIGNTFRRDDGIGPAVAETVAAQHHPGVRVLSCVAEPTAILDAWSGSGLAVLVDAAVGPPPGQVRTTHLDDLAEPVTVSSHDLSLRQTWELGRALDRAPGEVLVVTIGVADTGHGTGLTPAVAAALPEAVGAVLGVLEARDEAGHQQP